MAKSVTNAINWVTAARMRRPPEAPAANQGLSPIRRIIGDMLVNGRLPPPIELAWFGRGSNHITPLFIRMPDFGRTTRLPIDDSNVDVMATMVPSWSQTVRCVVQVSAACGSASPSPASRSAYAFFSARDRAAYQPASGLAPALTDVI